MKLKEVKLDELELYLNILKSEHPDFTNNASSLEIANVIQERFKVKCSDRDIFLIHEPTLEEEMIDIELQYNILFNGK